MAVSGRRSKSNSPRSSKGMHAGSKLFLAEIGQTQNFKAPQRS